MAQKSYLELEPLKPVLSLLECGKDWVGGWDLDNKGIALFCSGPPFGFLFCILRLSLTFVFFCCFSLAFPSSQVRKSKQVGSINGLTLRGPSQNAAWPCLGRWFRAQRFLCD